MRTMFFYSGFARSLLVQLRGHNHCHLAIGRRCIVGAKFRSLTPDDPLETLI